MQRDGTVLAKEVSEDETKEDIEIADENNGNNNGKHLERYIITNSFIFINYLLQEYHQ